MATLRLHKIAHRPIHRDRVTLRSNRPEVIMSLAVSAKIASHIHQLTVSFLQVVKAPFACLPHLDRSVRDRKTLCVGDLAVDHQFIFGRLLHDLCAQRQLRGPFTKERPQKTALRSEFLRLAVV